MRYAVNLFPPRKITLAQRIGYFTAHYLRYAIVLTLGVVIIIFFLRVRVDQELADEHERLAMRRAIVEATKPLRAQLERIKVKIDQIDVVYASQDKLNSQMSYITSVIPTRINVQSISLGEDTTQISALTGDYRIIPTFVAKLINDGAYESVQVTKVDKEAQGRYAFVVVVKGYKSKATSSDN